MFHHYIAEILFISYILAQATISSVFLKGKYYYTGTI